MKRCMPAELLLLATASLKWGEVRAKTAFTGDLSAQYTEYATKLHKKLVGEQSDYVKTLPPINSRRQNNYSAAGTDVRLQVRFFKVETVAVATGMMRVKIWLRCEWRDERLTWDPSEYGNITMLPTLGNSVSMPEETEIWLPDLKFFNTADSIIHTLDPAIAQVYSDGRVYWVRPGILDTLCKFSGLVAFPFDSLSCGIELGGWMLSGRYQGIDLSTWETGSNSENGPGWSLSGDETTTGSSYQEYTIAGVSTTKRDLYYACCADEPWPQVTYANPAAPCTKLDKISHASI